MKQGMIKAPFPWFGGKSRIVSLVWDRLGDVDNFVDPFCGSLAPLLGRPHAPRIETVNDKFCHLANFWRAIQHDPMAVAHWADWPVNEADMHARHRWLVNLPDFSERMLSDPDFYDAKVAGWWVWGQSIWIGAGWCSDWGRTVDGGCKKVLPTLLGERGVTRKLRGERGQAQRPQLSDGARGLFSSQGRKRPNIGDNHRGRGTSSKETITGLQQWFIELSERLRRVRVCCGDWRRVCNSPSTTTRIGLTGVFLDPPYGVDTGRDMDLYAEDGAQISKEVRAWCLKWGDNPRMRIALCGYAGEHDKLEARGWSVMAWQAQGGYANRGKSPNNRRGLERIWFSPACLDTDDLFSTCSRLGN